MATDKHTTEPREIRIHGRESDDRRISACLTACVGIPIEALEAGALRAAREALDQYMTALHAFAIERPHATVRELSSYLAGKGIPAAAMAVLAQLRGEG